MLKLIWNNFKRTNDCIILATPMVLFMFITVLYSAFIVTHAKTVNLALFSFVTLLIMICGFLAGWFYMVKKTLQLNGRMFVYEKDRINALKELILTLPNGVGRLFLPFLGVVTISMFITVFVYYTTVDIIPHDMLQKLADILLFPNYLAALLFIITSILSFFLIVWIPEVVYTERNPIKALGNSILKTMKTFPKTLFLYIFVYMIYFLTNFSVQLLPANPIIIFISLVLYYYFTLYNVILVFTYYERNFHKTES